MQHKAKTKIITPSVFNFSFRTKCFLLFCLCFGFYFNSINGDYLLDDNLVIVRNDYVQQGISGIGKIMTNDAYQSFMEKTTLSKHKLSGGRYRPLSIIIFAIEHSVFGESPMMRHLINLLFYCALLFAMLWFLTNILFKNVSGGGDIAFLAVCLFVIHPIHTEVVANIKSLDEILSLLLILLTFIFSIQYLKQQKIRDLIIALSSFLLALLAKEYAVMLLVLLPVLFYLTLNKNPKEVMISSLPYFGVFILYLFLRIHAVGLPSHVVNHDVAINPYLYATTMQKIATEIFVLGKYLFMLFIPYPLSYDYNYYQIQYHNLFDLSVLTSVVVYAGLLCWGVWLIYKRNIAGFAVFFFLLNIAIISNFIIDIGATMGERLVFHSSLGFVILIAMGIFALVKKLSFKTKQIAVFASLGILVIACGAETLARNKTWNNIYTLTTTDVNTVPNSLMANDYAAIAFIYLADEDKDSTAQAKIYLNRAKECAHKTITIIPDYYDGFFRLGIACDKLKMPDSAEYFLEKARGISPGDTGLIKYLANIYLTDGCNRGKKGDINSAIIQMRKGIDVAPNNAEIWYNLGGAYYSIQNYDSARAAWTKTLELNPSYTNAANGLQAIPVPNHR